MVSDNMVWWELFGFIISLEFIMYMDIWYGLIYMIFIVYIGIFLLVGMLFSDFKYVNGEM